MRFTKPPNVQILNHPEHAGKFGVILNVRREYKSNYFPSYEGRYYEDVRMEEYYDILLEDYKEITMRSRDCLTADDSDTIIFDKAPARVDPMPIWKKVNGIPNR